MRAARIGLGLGLLGGVLAGCMRQTPASHPHVTLGAPYQADGTWYYPHDSAATEETGIARVDSSDHPGLTADGEVYDPAAMAAAHQTMRLPAIAWITNLANGRQVKVRINDRGPASPHEFLSLTPRAATLLGLGAQAVAPVRLTLDVAATAEARAALPGDKLAIATAPQAAVQQAALAPLPGTRSTTMTTTALQDRRQAAPDATTAPVALRLPEQLRQVPVLPYVFWVRLGIFSSYGPARMQSARVIWLHPRIAAQHDGRSTSYRVDIGPFSNLADADAALDAVRRAKVGDARIAVE